MNISGSIIIPKYVTDNIKYKTLTCQNPLLLVTTLANLYSGSQVKEVLENL